MTILLNLGLPLDLHQQLALAPASLTTLALEEPVPRLVCLNNTSHLARAEGEEGV
jgi:hypothetical protein